MELATYLVFVGASFGVTFVSWPTLTEIVALDLRNGSRAD